MAMMRQERPPLNGMQMTAAADGTKGRRSAAYEEGFHSFPVSLPFAPLGVLSEHQRAFYEGWLAAAYELFANSDLVRPETRHDA